MGNVIHRASERGRSDHGWLSSRFSFSFADWFEPSRMGFGALRVLNDDTIAPASGFPMHGHRNMEIITIVTSGTLTHKDSLDNTGTAHAGDVQVMSAGSGIVHAEYNASTSEPLELFQIWIQTKEDDASPRYDQKPFAAIGVEDGIVLLVGPESAEAPLMIRQDAFISRTITDAAHPSEYHLHREGNGVYVFIIEGSAEVSGEKLDARDAVEISGCDTILSTTNSKADILFIEIPMEIRAEQ